MQLSTLSYVGIPDDLKVQDTNTTGSWGYHTGVSGVVYVPEKARVLQISVASEVDNEGVMKINDGDDILIPPGQSITIEPKGNLVGPVITLTNTTTYFIEYVV